MIFFDAQATDEIVNDDNVAAGLYRVDIYGTFGDADITLRWRPRDGGDWRDLDSDNLTDVVAETHRNIEIPAGQLQVEQDNSGGSPAINVEIVRISGFHG